MHSVVNSDAFTRSERQAVIMLSALYVVRMLGLFMVLPLIAIYATDMTGATPFLLGLAVGAYGLTQACLQIPMGWLSDLIDRRWVVAGGLLMLILGSAVAATASTIAGVIFGRFLQGSGAIASATMALAADFTRPSQRAKASAIIGASIAIAFALALVLGPALASQGGLQTVFWGTAALAFCGVLIVLCLPKPPAIAERVAIEGARFEQSRLSDVLQPSSLRTMYLSIFCLHFLLMAVFVVVPSSLVTEAEIVRDHHAWVYLGALLLSVPGIYILVKGRRYLEHPVKSVVSGLLILAAGLALLAWGGLAGTLLGLLLFFTGFTALEAILPSLTSIVAPERARGTAMGVFASSQFIGVFIGGVVGGYLLTAYGAVGVWLGMLVLIGLWTMTVAVSPLRTVNLAEAA